MWNFTYTTVEGLTAPEVFCALYNLGKPVGLGIAEYDANPLTVEEATKILEKQKYFDYFRGVPLKMWFDRHPRYIIQPYESRNGKGSFHKNIEAYKNGKTNVRVPSALAYRFSRMIKLSGRLK